MSENKGLSDREREILRLVATGASNKEIAQKLSISANTTKVHLRNIFAKIGVSSRTEATLFAIREGLVQVDRPMEEKSDAAEIHQPLAVSRSHIRLRRLAIVAVSAILFILILNLALSFRSAPSIALASPPSSAASRWKERAALLTPRASLAVATYENKIYAFGGENNGQVTSAAERYDPDSDKWEPLASKPTAVTEASAALIGGRIYVPGGRLAAGGVTNVLEVYDPQANRWEERASMPIPLAAYALAAFEGKIFVFGGWNGERYLASTFEYDPDADAWRARSAMPTLRGYAGTVVAAGKIFVIGGYDGNQALGVNEQYSPNRDDGEQNPWTVRKLLPAPRYAMGSASVADFVYVIGGKGDGKASLSPLQYFHQQDRWETFPGPVSQAWSHLGLVPVQTHLYALGGRVGENSSSRTLSYQAIFTIIIPPSP